MVFVDGLFEDTLTVETIARIGETAVVHVDCDLYRSARTVLERFPLVAGTILMFDEFWAPAGEWDWEAHEARAFHEICLERGLSFRGLFRRDVERGPLSEQVAFVIT